MRGVTAVWVMTIATDLFQPALPMRGVTARHVVLRGLVLISTRTPHAGSDGTVSSSAISSSVFQPALPMRGVTCRAL